MRGRRLWMKVSAHGSEVRVYVVKKELTVDGDPCDATFDPKTNTIEVEWSPNESAMKMHLIHELLHVCFDPMNADARAVFLGTKSVDMQSTREELMIGALTPPLYDILTRAGMLRIPKPPKMG